MAAIIIIIAAVFLFALYIAYMSGKAQGFSDGYNARQSIIFKLKDKK